MCGLMSCPRLTVVFSPAGGSLNFIREVENEMRNFQGRPSDEHNNNNDNMGSKHRHGHSDYLDV